MLLPTSNTGKKEISDWGRKILFWPSRISGFHLFFSWVRSREPKGEPHAGRWERWWQRQKKAKIFCFVLGELDPFAELHNKTVESGWFKEQKCISFTVLEAGSPRSKSWLVSFWGLSCLVDTHLLSLSSHSLFSGCPQVCILTPPL